MLALVYGQKAMRTRLRLRCCAACLKIRGAGPTDAAVYHVKNTLQNASHHTHTKKIPIHTTYTHKIPIDQYMHRDKSSMPGATFTCKNTHTNIT